jgi:hypothetical protein
MKYREYNKCSPIRLYIQNSSKITYASVSRGKLIVDSDDAIEGLELRLQLERVLNKDNGLTINDLKLALSSLAEEESASNIYQFNKNADSAAPTRFENQLNNKTADQFDYEASTAAPDQTQLKDY